MKRRSMQLLGWTVLSIPYFHWDCLSSFTMKAVRPLLLCCLCLLRQSPAEGLTVTVPSDDSHVFLESQASLLTCRLRHRGKPQQGAMQNRQPFCTYCISYSIFGAPQPAPVSVAPRFSCAIVRASSLRPVLLAGVHAEVPGPGGHSHHAQEGCK